MIKYSTDSEVSSVATIDKTTGVFTLNECTEAKKWQVWLSATGDDGMSSGENSVFNMMINLYDPPATIDLVLPPKFVFDAKSGPVV